MINIDKAYEDGDGDSNVVKGDDCDNNGIKLDLYFHQKLSRQLTSLINRKPKYDKLN